jgi:exoribonuclease-2
MTGNALAVYKQKAALVKEKTGDKILIAVSGGEQLKVREKDIEIIHPGPAGDLGRIEENAANMPLDAIKETWELLLESGPVSLRELAELAFGGYGPASAWAAYRLLLDGLYFTGTVSAISPRRREDIEAGEKKRGEKQREAGEREQFLERLKNRRIELPGDSHFMQDVEALALGKSPKSRTVKDLGLSETPQDAHALLLDSRFWTAHVNPYPARFGLSLASAKTIPGPPPAEERRDLTHLAAFAIDSPWSHDPDDAISIENEGGGQTLYVHVADPACSITPDGPQEQEARGRGATLYLPEGSFRMLADEALPFFALGLAETSPALTFKMTLNADGEIASTEIFPSTVKVQRLTYHDADALMENQAESAALALCNLYALAERNLYRRTANGAVNIDLPETHIGLDNGTVRIDPVVSYRSADMVRECMLLAGEGAGIWAAGGCFGKSGSLSLPFPFVGQETGDLPNKPLPGMAGSYQLRRCMRPRILSVKPCPHYGLGLDTYTQVTSPLRRYTDLLAHLQIRTLLRSGEPLSADDVSARLAAGEAAALAVMQAERASRSHWTMVYLSEKKDSQWDAVALEKKGNRQVFIIPALALETQVSMRNEIAPNERLILTLKSVNIAKGEAVFVAGE